MRRVPARSAVAVADTWDLTALYADEQAWERDFRRFQREIERYRGFDGQLANGSGSLRDCLELDSRVSRRAERLGAFAFLRTAEDQANSDHQRMLGRYQSVATKAGELSSFIRPEILAIPVARARRLLTQEDLQPFHLRLERLFRYRPHTLGRSEERLLAMQGEVAQTATRAFRQLLDADMKFARIRDERGRMADLTHATYRQFLQSPVREVRKRAFHQYYAQFLAHENTLAATLAGAVHRDNFYARARGHASALQAALFPDAVPEVVYSQLVETVRQRLPVLHRYLDLRRRKLKLRDLHAYDLDVPLVADVAQRRSWDQGVCTILEALAPLGGDYIRTLETGLRGRWCDRYPNRGKQSGAFSCGTFDGEPYILMNYKPDVLEDVFTLAHEAGHSMHSYYSARSQPFEYYDYSIFVAEVASTFNEQLLSRHLRATAKDDRVRAYLINRDIDAIRATLIRQTMFAEFERLIHETSAAGEPLTVASLAGNYRQLLRDYFGAEFVVDEPLTREGLRIPHFYRAFYVYKYATGLSAAIALSEQVLTEPEHALPRYRGFLRSGSSKDPLPLLRDAGVDMAQSGPVQVALDHFERSVAELEDLLG